MSTAARPPLDRSPLLRIAVPQDADAIADHLRVIATEGFIGLDPAQISAAAQREQLLTLDLQQAIAVVIGNTPSLIGLAIAVRQRRPMAHTAVVAISVDPAHRRAHHGLRLLGALEVWAMGRNVTKLCASCLGTNRAAQRLFMSAGYAHEGTRRQQLSTGTVLSDEVLFGRLLGPAIADGSDGSGGRGSGYR